MNICFLIIQHQFHLDGSIISNSSWFMKHHSFVSSYCNQGSFYLPIFSPYPVHKTYSSFPIHYIVFIFFFFNQSYWATYLQSELLSYLPLFPIVPIFICISALHIFLSGLLVSASIPWSSCCLSFLLYKHCEYQKISDTGVATFFLLYLYSLCMYNIHLYTCIYLKIKVHLYFLRAQLVCKN